MSQPFPQIAGPSYLLDNHFAAVERCVNWYCLPNENAGDDGKFKVALEPCPGNSAFGVLPVPAPFNQQARGLIELRGQVFGVNGTAVFQLNSDGTYINVGTVATDGIPAMNIPASPVSMVANGNGQIFIASAERGYMIPSGGGANSLITIADPGFLGASYASFQDGYILTIVPRSNIFQISGDDSAPVGDATKWSAANVSVQAGQADFLRAIISSREYVRLLGARRSQINYNVGNSGIGNFPFQSYNETFIETGIAAAYSLADLGDSLIWIGEDSRGMRACWRDAAFQPTRVSNFAVEQKWQEYARVDDAVALTYLWKGHLLYQITFPSAVVANPPTGFPLGARPTYHSATWLYDATSSQLLGKQIWVERQYLTAQGFLEGRSEQFHCYAFGRHLVSSTGVDGNPGAVYQYAADGTTGFTDCGVDTDGVTQVQQPIVRDRIVRGPWGDNDRVIVNRLQLICNLGVGLDGAPIVGANPQIYLRISRDSGNTWGPELNTSVGAVGQYSLRVLFNRLGYSRDMVFWIRFSDPCAMGLIGAELDLFKAGS